METFKINSKGVKGSRLIQSSIIIMNALQKSSKIASKKNELHKVVKIQKEIREHAEGISDLMHEAFFLLSPERQEEILDWDKNFGL